MWHLYSWKSWSFSKLAQASDLCLAPTCPTESRSTLHRSSSPDSPSVLQSSWKSNWDSGTSFIHLTFRLIGLYFLFYVHIHHFLRSEQLPVAVLSIPNLTCMLSLAEGNSPTPHQKMSLLNQKIKIQAEGGALQTQSPSHMYRGPQVMTEQDYLKESLLSPKGN